MSANKAIYLASKSPRRKELLTQIAIDFELIDIDVDESLQDGEEAAVYVRRLASEKAQAGLLNSDGLRPVLGADTIVVLGDKILGKPRDKNDAVAMLLSLSNGSHQVMTAIAVATSQGVDSDVIITDVTFREISPDEALAYWLTKEPVDKAGGYGIQGHGGKFVKNINGSYFAVVGLPLMETQLLLEKMTTTA